MSKPYTPASKMPYWPVIFAYNPLPTYSHASGIDYTPVPEDEDIASSKSCEEVFISRIARHFHNLPCISLRILMKPKSDRTSISK
jgi:hypothetical protein